MLIWVEQCQSNESIISCSLLQECVEPLSTILVLGLGGLYELSSCVVYIS